MSHVSHIKVGLKSKASIECALGRFNLVASEIEGRLHIPGEQFGLSNSKYNIDFIWVKDAQEYELVADIWALGLRDSTLPKNFVKEFTLEYTKQMVQLEAQSLGLNIGEWESDGRGNLQTTIGSATAQMHVQIAPSNLVRIGVEGMIGATCQQFSAQLENALGAVESTQLTAEFYAGQQEQAMVQQQITTGW